MTEKEEQRPSRSPPGGDVEMANFNTSKSATALVAEQAKTDTKKDEAGGHDEDEIIMKLSEPMRLTNIMVDRPVIVVVFSYICMIILTVIVGGLGWLTPSENTNRDFLVWGNEYTNDYDKSELVKEELAVPADGSTAVLQQTPVVDWAVLLIYDPEGSTTNLWTKESLIAIRAFEDDVKKMDDFASICLANSVNGSKEDVVCDERAFSSPLDLFSDKSKIEDMTQDELDTVLLNALNNGFDRYFDVKVSTTNLKVEYLRSIFTGAGPINDGSKRFSSIKDDRLEQNKFVSDFQVDVHDMTESGNAKYAGVRMRLHGQLYFQVYFMEVLAESVAFAIFSIMFVMFFIWYHLGSFFMAALSMLGIILSFPLTYFIYRGIFQITLNGTLNQLTIFIVLGIAADDIFVFCDAWRQSSYIKAIRNDEHRRLAYSFRRALSAIAVTSTTTAAAFLANVASDITPIRAFGIFAAIIIPVNFAIVIFVMPSIQIIHDRYFKEKCAYSKCCRCCKKDKNTADVKDADAEPEKDCLTVFFGGSFNNAMFKGRYVVTIVGILLAIVAAYFAQDIGPLTKEEEFVPEGDEYITFLTEINTVLKPLSENSNGQGKGAIFVNLNWGIKDLDRDDVGLWDPTDAGKIIWDDDFNVAPPDNQKALLDLCNDLLKDDNPLVTDKDVSCWMLGFDSYVRSDSAGTKSVPLSETEFTNYLGKYLQTPQGQGQVQNQYLGFDTNGKLRYMKVQVKTLGELSFPREKKLPIRDAWDAFIVDFAKTAPEGMKLLYHDAKMTFTLMESELAFYNGARTGVGISAALSFIILLIATGNILVSLYALKTVFFIVWWVIASMTFSGWELGVPESVAVVIAIGFSVDYVVHLAAHYVHSHNNDRYKRSSEAVADMGISIFSGAMTTLGAGVFLFGGKIIFFTKFGQIIVTTIIASLAYALCYFLAFMHAFGPQNKQGNIMHMFRTCRDKCKKKDA